MKIALGNDHGGLEYKLAIKKHLVEKNYEVIDCGTDSKESCDYPIFAKAAAEKVSNHEADFGIVVCTSGEGVAIVANKIKGIRCGIGYDDGVCEKLRQHNNANMVSFGQNYMKLEDVLHRVDIFLSTPFEGGRHERRVNEINDLD